jgi:hypothetical protein
MDQPPRSQEHSDILELPSELVAGAAHFLPTPVCLLKLACTCKGMQSIVLQSCMAPRQQQQQQPYMRFPWARQDCIKVLRFMVCVPELSLLQKGFCGALCASLPAGDMSSVLEQQSSARLVDTSAAFVCGLMLDSGAWDDAEALSYALVKATHHGGGPEVCKLLLDGGGGAWADAEVLADALTSAVFGGGPEVCKLLLDSGGGAWADANVLSFALIGAVRLDRVEVCKLLLDRSGGAWADAETLSYALTSAILFGGDPEVCKLLLDSGGGAWAGAMVLSNALNKAVRRGRVEVCKLLLDRSGGAWADAKTLTDALAEATPSGHVAEALSNALRDAAHRGRVEECKLLVGRRLDAVRRAP